VSFAEGTLTGGFLLRLGLVCPLVDIHSLLVYPRLHRSHLVLHSAQLLAQLTGFFFFRCILSLLVKDLLLGSAALCVDPQHVGTSAAFTYTVRISKLLLTPYQFCLGKGFLEFRQHADIQILLVHDLRIAGGYNLTNVLFEALVRDRVKDLQDTLDGKEPYINDELPVHLLAVSLVKEVSRDSR
jgi:hypothetical protein